MLWLSFFWRSFAHIFASSSVEKNVGVMMRCPGNGAERADGLPSEIGWNMVEVCGIYELKVGFVTNSELIIFPKQIIDC